MSHLFKGRSWLRPLLLSAVLRLSSLAKSNAEDRVEYRYEDYSEEHDRIHVRTHAVGFERELSSRIVAKGSLVYDGISGATPTGELPAAGTRSLPLAEIEDIRRAFSLDLGYHRGRHTFTPQISYSEERDYVSKGLAATYTADFNRKNTTLVAGYSRNFDSVGGGILEEFIRKDANDFLVGIHQLLGPKTVLTVNASIGYSDGYLDDPYRRTMFLLADSPDPIFSDPGLVNSLPEHRPRHRFKQAGYFSLTHYVTPLSASVEATYRLYHDDWGILAHTTGLAWHQKLGKRVRLSPSFRYYRQGEAAFYAPSFRGVSFEQYAGGTRVAFDHGVFLGFEDEPSFPSAASSGSYQVLSSPARPSYYSSDYRLARLESMTYGVSLQVKLHERVTLDLAYKRYDMRGLDHATPREAFPSANVVTIGCGLWF